MTGRKSRMVKAQEEVNKYVYEDRRGAEETSKVINVNQREAFMEGRKLIAIISEAASTGVSLHASQK